MSRNSISRYLWPIRPMILRRSSPRCQPTIEFAGARVPFHDTYSCSGQRPLWCRSPRCQPTIEVGQWAARFSFHDTCSYFTIRHSGADRSVVSRQSSSLGQEFHFTIPVAVRALGYFGADRSVVSRQSSSLGQEFHFTIPVVVPPSGALVQIGSLSADNRRQQGARFPFHDTCSRSALGCSGTDRPVVSRQSPPAMSQISISRYL